MWCNDVLKTTHTLIAGASGSGKSQAVKNVLYTAYSTLNRDQLKVILIDNKQTTFKPFKRLPQTLYYAVNLEEIDRVLQLAVNMMWQRYEDIKEDIFAECFEGSAVYIVIDEIADLMNVTKTKDKERKELQQQIIENLTKISQLGRASNIHIIACTQCATKGLLDNLKANFSCFIALHTATHHDSRNIIQMSGAERLPLGEFFMLLDGNITKETFGLVTKEQLKDLLWSFGIYV